METIGGNGGEGHGGSGGVRGRVCRVFLGGHDGVEGWAREGGGDGCVVVMDGARRSIDRSVVDATADGLGWRAQVIESRDVNGREIRVSLIDQVLHSGHKC